MNTERFSFALEHGGLVVPDDGLVALIGPGSDADLSEFAPDRTVIVQTLQPHASRFTARGYRVVDTLDTPVEMAIVTLPRARELAQLRIAEAAGLAKTVVIDGNKTDGIDSILKAIKARTEIVGRVSKAHGKVFWFAPDADFSDWQHAPQMTPSGFLTAPGVFSADGPDPASQALLDALPDKLGAEIADFGGGWGFLSHSLLQKAGLQTLHLIEADNLALDCARANLHDPRVQFHWADATSWTPPAFLDTVVMNPPFHTTARKADPALGQAFIAQAARALKPHGELWMVANRHLPYETTLATHFRTVDEIAGTAAFKIFHAKDRPRTRR